MRGGSSYYLWYVKIAGVRGTVLGVYEEPPPEGMVGVDSVGIGGGRAAQALRFGTEAVGAADDFLDKLNPLP